MGGHGDYVWKRGGCNGPPELETWVMAAGGSAASIHTIRQPETYCDQAMVFAANTVFAGLLVVLDDAVAGVKCSRRVRVQPLEVFPDAGQRANQLRPQPWATGKLLGTLAWAA